MDKIQGLDDKVFIVQQGVFPLSLSPVKELICLIFYKRELYLRDKLKQCFSKAIKASATNPEYICYIEFNRRLYPIQPQDTTVPFGKMLTFKVFELTSEEQACIDEYLDHMNDIQKFKTLCTILHVNPCNIRDKLPDHFTALHADIARLERQYAVSIPENSKKLFEEVDKAVSKCLSLNLIL